MILHRPFAPASGSMRGIRAAAGMFLLLAGGVAIAQTTVGNVANGTALYNANCDSCHGATPGATLSRIEILNAANAGGVINRSMVNGMGGYNSASFNATQEADMAAYIAGYISSANAAVAHNTPTAIPIPNIYINTTYGDFTTGTGSNGTRGTVSMSVVGATLYANYTPTTGQCGSDSFTVRATDGASYTSNLRSVTVDIADPAAPNLSTSLAARAGTYNTFLSFSPTNTGGASTNYDLTAGALPTGMSLTASTGTISGTPTVVGSFPITLRARNCFNGVLTGQSGTKAITITISKSNQSTLTALINGFSTDRVFTYSSPNGTATLSTSGGSGTGLVTFASSNTAVCTVSGTTLTLVGGGTCTVTATKAADTNYNVAADTINVTVNKAVQTITFPVQATPSRNYVQGGTFAISPVATASSGLGVTYDSNTPSICSHPGDASTTVAILAAGTCTIGANQIGNANYNIATEATQNITINGVAPAAPTGAVGSPGDAQASISFAAPSNTGGLPILSYTATCTAAGQTTRTGSGAASPIVVGTVPLPMANGVTYSCSVTATNAAGTGLASIAANVTPSATPVPPAFTSSNNATFTVLTAGGSFNVTATGTPTPAITLFSGTLPTGMSFSGGAGMGTLSGTPASGQAGSRLLTFRATSSAGTLNQSFTLTVSKLNQVLTFAPASKQGFSPTPIPLTATATLAPVTFESIDPAICTVSGSTFTTLQLGDCTLVASQAGDADYNPVGSDKTLVTIVPGAQTISFPAQSSQTYSAGSTFFLSPLASASSGLQIGYSSATPGVCTVVDDVAGQIGIVAVGICSITATQKGNEFYDPADQASQDISIFQANQVISWGAQSGVAFGAGGTFAINPLATGGASGNPVVYSSTTPAVCTVSGTTVTKVSAGLCTMLANQAGDSNYSAAAPVQRSLIIAASVAGAPVATQITPSDSQVIIDFDPPTSNGGSPITNYAAVCVAPGQSNRNAIGPASPLTVTQLTNGVTYTCGVVAVNAAGNSAASNTLIAMPFLATGANLWTDVCAGCHGVVPAGVRFNAAGQTGTVINYVRSVQDTMLAQTAVQVLTLNELAEIAKYIDGFLPAISAGTAFNAPVMVDVASHLTVPSVTFEGVEVVDQPLHGTLSVFNGTQVTYTPNPGYVGPDSFTYRGYRTTPVLKGDKRTVSVTVDPPPIPVITSPAIASGMFNSPFSYQITATNSPVSFGAAPLGANFTLDTTSGAVSGTPLTTGVFNVTVSATNAGGTGTQIVEITISKANQTIAFGAQAGRNFAPSPGNTFSLSPLATASSGLAISYSSLTPSVCTIAGTVVSMLSAGTCTIAANQAGNANYNAALQVTQNIAISATAPGAPVIGAATAGDAQASVAFTAPANTGGSPITAYSATCSPNGAGTNSVSPISISGLTNGQLYTCSVTATNAAGTSVASGSVGVTPTATPVPPAITSANATTFTVLSPGTFTVTATGTPTPVRALTGTLPAGVIFTAASGVLSGTPAANTVGSYTLNVTASDPSAVNPQAPANQTLTLTVQKANQSITFAALASQAFTAVSIPLTATSTSALPVTLVSDTTSVCTVSGFTLALVTVGTCSITASQPGDANYNAATSVTRGFTVSQAAQAITFPSQAQTARNFVGGSTFAIAPVATASSGLAVSYTSTTQGVCTIVGTTVTMVAPGTCTIAANQSGSANYLAAPQVTVNVALNATAPGAPVIGTATGGNGQATINFTAPASNGGSAISSFTATCNPGNITGTGAASPIVVSGLTNNVTYNCAVTATNGVGTGAASATVAVTPLSGQGAALWTQVCDVCHTAVPSGNQLNGAGTTATALNYVRANQPVMAFSTAVQSLSNADLADLATYIAANIPANTPTTTLNVPVQINVANHITLTAQAWSAFNAIEIVSGPSHGSLGAFTGTQILYTPANGYVGTDSFTYRGKRTGGIAYDGDPQTITISVLPPAPVITSATSASGTFNQMFTYQITASNSPTSFDASGLPPGLSVDSLTGAISGVPSQSGLYSVAISATNVGGTGEATLPLQIDPTSQVIDFPAQTTASRVFSAGAPFAISPVATGGASGNPVVYGSNSPLVCTVNGTTVTIVLVGICMITANQAGDTNFASAAQVTQNVNIVAAIPSAPVIGPATPGNGQASISFSAPVNNGGSSITGYTATCGAATASGAASPIVVMGLANGVSVACTVSATNIAGTGPESAAVNVTPTSATAPGAPVIGAATPGDGQAGIAFTAPASNGGSPITSYTATCNPGAITGSGATSPITVSGLTNGVAYSCSVRAINAIGTGPASSSVAVTPLSPIAFSGIVRSRKTHAGAGDFPLDVNPAIPIGGAITIEPRVMGPGHLLVFQFTAPVTSVNSVAVANALGNPVGSATVAAVGNTAEVTLVGIPDNQRVLVTLSGVNGSVSASAAIGFLVGDVNQTGRVSSADIAAIKSRNGALLTTGQNFLFDVNLNGSISSTDVTTAKARAGKILP